MAAPVAARAPAARPRAVQVRAVWAALVRVRAARLVGRAAVEEVLVAVGVAVAAATRRF
jgi:hypothetical protein